MTWTANFTGHVEDREDEKRVGERLQEVARELGAMSFTFHGNLYVINDIDGEAEKVPGITA